MIHRSRIDWHLTPLFKVNGLQVYFITKRVNNTRNGDLQRSQRAKFWVTLSTHCSIVSQLGPDKFMSKGVVFADESAHHI